MLTEKDIRVLYDRAKSTASIAQKTRESVERFLFRGEHRTVLSLAEEFGRCRHVIRKRINAGWDVERAVMQPTRHKNVRD